jgi:hypothetical protein
MTNPTPNFPKYAAHQGTYLHAPAFIHSLILKTCYASDQTTGLANNARYAMQINSRSNTRDATNTNIDIPHPVTTMDDDGEQRDLTFDDLEAYTRWPYTDGQLFLAMMTAEVKFSRPDTPKSSSALSGFTCSTKTSKPSTSPRTLARAPTPTPFSTPQKKHKLDCDELDAL